MPRGTKEILSHARIPGLLESSMPPGNRDDRRAERENQSAAVVPGMRQCLDDGLSALRHCFADQVSRRASAAMRGVRGNAETGKRRWQARAPAEWLGQPGGCRAIKKTGAEGQHADAIEEQWRGGETILGIEHCSAAGQWLGRQAERTAQRAGIIASAVGCCCYLTGCGNCPNHGGTLPQLSRAEAHP